MTDFQLGNVRIYEPVLDRMLNSQSGEVGRYLGGVGRKILVQAQALAGTRTGRLRASLYVSQSRFARGQLIQVGSPLDYAYYNHEGTRAYTIRAKGNRVMTFTSGGRRIYTRSVTHPRTRGTHFLTIPLRRVLG